MQVVTIVRLRRFSLSESERLVYIPGIHVEKESTVSVI